MSKVDPTFGTGLFVFLTLLITFGIVGNVLSFITWSTGKRCRHLPISSYFKPLAIVDTCILLFPAMELLMVMSPAHIVLREMNIVFCKLLPFVINPTLRLSTWITVVFSVEKVLHIYMPFTFPLKHNKKRVYVTVAMLALISYGIGLPFLFDVTLITVDDYLVSNGSLANSNVSIEGTNTTLADDYDAEDILGKLVYACNAKFNSFTETHYLKGEMIFNIFGLFAIPFTVLLVCNILILVKMMKRSTIAIGRVDEQQQVLRQKQFKYATYQVIAVSLVQCISTLPFSVMDVVLIILTNQEGWEFFQYFFEIYYSCNCLTYLNSAVNFILYCSVGSDFRQDFIDRFYHCRYSSHRENSSYISNDSSASKSPKTTCTNCASIATP